MPKNPEFSECRPMSTAERAVSDRRRLRKLAPAIAAKVMPEILAREKLKKTLLAIPKAKRAKSDWQKLARIADEEIMLGFACFAPAISLADLRQAWAERKPSRPFRKSAAGTKAPS